MRLGHKAVGSKSRLMHNPGACSQTVRQIGRWHAWDIPDYAPFGAACVGKAYIALTRVMVDSVFGKKPADHSLLLIGSAIMVGHAEDRPMNATKISHYVGLPRSTVIRKLNQF